jgi:IclR family transcriptional regulator, pca regulon regulatory protein
MGQDDRADREYVAGLERGLAVLEAFGRQQGRMTVTEAAGMTGLARATARRCLRSLVRSACPDGPAGHRSRKRARG